MMRVENEKRVREYNNATGGNKQVSITNIFILIYYFLVKFFICFSYNKCY